MFPLPIILAKLSELPFNFFAAGACKPNNFFFLPPWWKYLPSSQLSTDSLGGCSIAFHFPGDIWLVALAVIDMLLRIAGFVAVIMIIVAGFQFQFTMGAPDKAAAARKRIINAVIGLAIALVATVAVTFIGNQFAGS